jgi:ABC-type nickel/cobalt efflux system permease component RcnA
MGSIFELQRWLYSEAAQALQALNTAGLAGVPALIGAAFLFGMLHALMPGHGKIVLTSHYAGVGGFRGAVGSTIVVIWTHVGLAILLVLGGFAIVQGTIGQAGRAPALQLASQVLITLVGLWLLWRALRPHTHHHGGSGVALGFVAGLVPCPLTTFIMSYAVLKNLVWPGLLLSGTFAAGMIVTVAAFPLLAVLTRTRLLPLMARTETLRSRVGRGLEIAAALAVICLGLWPLLF